MKGKVWQYYRCQATRKGKLANKTCRLPMFRVDQVDMTVWLWLVKLLRDPQVLQEGLDARQAENEQQANPLKERLVVTDSLIAENQAQLNRVLELYISGEFSKEMLVERKNRLESAIKALTQEQARIRASLEKDTLTPDKIQDIYYFAERISQGLDKAIQSPEAMRAIIDILDVRVSIAVEDGKKIVYAQCVLDSQRLDIVSSITPKSSAPNSWVLCLISLR